MVLYCPHYLFIAPIVIAPREVCAQVTLQTTAVYTQQVSCVHVVKSKYNFLQVFTCMCRRGNFNHDNTLYALLRGQKGLLQWINTELKSDVWSSLSERKKERKRKLVRRDEASST